MILKKTIIGLLFALSLIASPENFDEVMVRFISNELDAKGINHGDIKILNTKNIESGWKATKILVSIEKDGIKEKAEEIIISNGDYIVTNAINIKTGKTIRDKLVNFKETYYDEDYLVLGSKKAKNKILIISDPFCPFCKDVIGRVADNIEKKKDVALYIYEIPLKIHKGSENVVKFIYTLNDKKDIIKIYKAKAERSIVQSTSKTKIKEWIESVIKKKISIVDAENPKNILKITRARKVADELGAKSTPTIFLNGEHQLNLQKINAILK